MLPTIMWGGVSAERAQEIIALYPPATYRHDHIRAEKTSILITQIHDLLSRLSITTSRPRLVWIEEAQLLTIPAQNALLKILEEPPASTEFVLTCPSAHALLPTIRSRCRIVALSVAHGGDSVDNDHLAVIKQALSLSDGDRIVLADSLGRKRDECKEWCYHTLHAVKAKLATEKSAKALRILTDIGRLTHAAHVDLVANVNVSLVMQNMILHLPHTRS